MNTTENNKIIAEFMGMKIINFKGIDYVENTGSLTVNTIDDLESFTYDWNWLMEVVEKIESLGNHGFTIYRKTTNINGLPIELSNTRKATKQEAVYNGCLDFIKWYNEQKSA